MSLGLGQVAAWPASLKTASSAFATSLPAHALSGAFPLAPRAYHHSSLHLPFQNLLPYPSFSGQQVSLVRDTPLKPCPPTHLVTDPSCHHPTALDLSKLATGNLHFRSLQFGIVDAFHGMAPVEVSSELQPAEISLKSPFVWP